MHKQDGCSECERQWSEYEEATRMAFFIESKVQVAALSQDSDTMMRLQPELHETIERRRTLRKQILAHDVAAHGQADTLKT